MVNFNLLGVLVSVAGLAAAAPTTRDVVGRATQEYVLKTKVISGDPKMNDLYVEGYHTGAGSNDATLTSNITYASKGFLNGTYQEFDYNTDFPWGLTLLYSQTYARWLSVGINAGQGDAGFSIGEHGLTSSNPEFRGWLACDWWHGVPQLFWQYYFEDTTIPCSCAKVELCAVAV